MKTLILYYSYTGSSKKYAEDLAAKMNAECVEVKTDKRPGTISAYVLGSFAAMRHKTVGIRPINKDLGSYNQIVLIAPIWAGSPAPAFNSMLELLASGTKAELHFLSGSGSSNKQKITDHVKRAGIEITGYHDIKQSTLNR